MNQPSLQQNFWNRFSTYLRRLSIRRKVMFIILVSFLLTLPSVILSLNYITQILQQINLIIQRDVAMGRDASDLSLMMLNMTRNERTYRLVGNSIEQDSVYSQLDQARGLITSAAALADQTEMAFIKKMNVDLDNFQKNFDQLTNYIEQYSLSDITGSGQNRITPELETFQNQYRDLLIQLEMSEPSQRDSLITYLSEQLDTITSDILIGTGTIPNRTLPPGNLQENLDTISRDFQNTTQQLASHSWESMQSDRADAFYIEARAKRNILMVLIFTTFLYLYMLISLPVQIVKPVTRLNALLKKTVSGDFREHAREYSNDEIGDLAATYNDVLDRFQQYEDLKTRKIASQKRMMDRFLEMINIPAAMMTSNLVLQYYNQPFAEFFPGVLPPKAPDTGVELKHVEGAEEFADELHEFLNSTRTEFVVMLADHNGMKHRLKGRLIRNPLMEQESVLLMETPNGAEKKQG